MRGLGCRGLIVIPVALFAAGILSGCLSPTGYPAYVATAPASEAGPAIEPGPGQEFERAPGAGQEDIMGEEVVVQEAAPWISGANDEVGDAPDTAVSGGEGVSAGSAAGDTVSIEEPQPPSVPGQAAGQGPAPGADTGSVQIRPTAVPRQAPGRSPGSAPGTVAIQGAPAGWSVYQDDSVGFRIAYPPAYVILPERTDALSQPAPVAEVLFQERHVAQSDVAAFAPPAFSVRVFRNDARLDVAEWLVANQFTNQTGARSLQEQVVGGVTAWRYCRAQQFAPNCAIYLSRGGYLFEMVPNGAYDSEMLATFRLTR